MRLHVVSVVWLVVSDLVHVVVHFLFVVLLHLSFFFYLELLFFVLQVLLVYLLVHGLHDGVTVLNAADALGALVHDLPSHLIIHLRLARHGPL